jgi:hypothetical protein
VTKSITPSSTLYPTPLLRKKTKKKNKKKAEKKTCWIPRRKIGFRENGETQIPFHRHRKFIGRVLQHAFPLGESNLKKRMVQRRKQCRVRSQLKCELALALGTLFRFTL